MLTAFNFVFDANLQPWGKLKLAPYGADRRENNIVTLISNLYILGSLQRVKAPARGVSCSSDLQAQAHAKCNV